MFKPKGDDDVVGSHEKPLLTVPETADYLGLGKTLTWELVGQGVIPSVRLGRLVRVPRVRLEAWLASDGAADTLTKHRPLRRVS